MFLSTLTILRRDSALRAALMKKLLSKCPEMWYNVLGTAIDKAQPQTEQMQDRCPSEGDC